uniref:Uncharacterized protein n=1 Tax=Anguilla anguilla TaxID=7936 RepID=A0A0E9SRF8_ANGAN
MSDSQMSHSANAQTPITANFPTMPVMNIHYMTKIIWTPLGLGLIFMIWAWPP